MKNLRIISSLFLTLLFAWVALGQAGKPDLPDAPQPQASDSAQSEKAPDVNPGPSGENTVIGQAARYPRSNRRPVRVPRGRGYQSAAPMPGLSPVGVIIGFGIGAGLGASGSQDRSASARVASGLIVGAIGAVIGGAIGAFPHARRSYPPSDPDDDDDSDLRSDAKRHGGRFASAKTAALRESTRVEATPHAPSGEPAMP